MEGLFFWIELTAALLVLLNVYLLTRERIAAWPVGLLAVLLYLYIFATSKLYSDSMLQLVFAGLNLYGWWVWSRKGPAKNALPISRMSSKTSLLWGLAALAGSLAWGRVMSLQTDADFAYWDAFTTVASLLAQYLLAIKKLENWIVWIIVDVVAINIYYLKGLHITALLYFLLLLLCIKGLRDWHRSMQTQTALP